MLKKITHKEIYLIVCKYAKGFLDEWLRVEPQKRSENKIGNYKTENPHLNAGTFYSLLLDIEPDHASEYQHYYASEVIPMCRGKVFGTYSRQPNGLNYYPRKHSNFKSSVWNRISRDEIVGLFAIASPEDKMILREACEANMPMDDFGVYNKRYRLDFKTRYYCIKGMDGKPSFLMKLAWNIDRIYDVFQVKILRHFARQKSIADTVIKNYVRAKAGVGRQPSKHLMVWACDVYFSENHPFKKMVRKI
jgi:hypothetical protein